MTKGLEQERDRRIARTLIRWFRANARNLPWRTRPLGTRRDPYRVLVSEIMLQQTQASRVVDRFEDFLGRFPTVEDLARGAETEVLAAWSGLGYYRRARLLHASARAIVDDHGGRFPEDAAGLARLPGLGRYTSGAVASLCFHDRVGAVDANVARVMVRLEGRALSASDGEAGRLAWARAAALLEASPRSKPTPALLNEALIEFGALVCTPRAPRCAGCPISGECVAMATGQTQTIPVPKRAKTRPVLWFASVLVGDGAGRLAVTRRASEGLWAGLYQAPTVESTKRAPTRATVRRELGLPSRHPLDLADSFAFQTTHRDCRFDVYAASALPANTPESWSFLRPEEIAEVGLSTPQRRILLEISRAHKPGGE